VDVNAASRIICANLTNQFIQHNKYETWKRILFYCHLVSSLPAWKEAWAAQIWPFVYAGSVTSP
jgi:hypothetical protein